ncbi:DUF924 domain-containing protein [Novosphingobium sp. YJ-S2-02]|uniref:DUF924 domain-containing protein n=1 Tax=Novosphingobium aureum TaxID=2792964 RepID=A0A931HA70_9SPHN|nr:DUF924 family protein [Novosphingobium aureum]MBH0111771.1 DUF924 domain-containing protein [Novosphingobium aureum]
MDDPEASLQPLPEGEQRRVLDFWFRELTPDHWFGAGSALDPLVRKRFAELHEQASEGALDAWAQTPLGRLALIIVLDQFSRHIHRDTARAFANDARAQHWTTRGIAAGMDEQLSFAQRHFFYMPLMHAEDPSLQAQSMECFAGLREFAESLLSFARTHRDEIAAHGRFPYRNAALGRENTEAERRFLEERD